MHTEPKICSKSLQLTQNRLLRVLNKTRIADKVSIRSMLDKFKLASVNQLAAEIKLLEVWKSVNVAGCPINLEPYNPQSSQTGHQLRPKLNRVFNDTARLQVSKSSFNIDAAKLWNYAPEDLRIAVSLTEAKRLIKIHCKTIPL